MTRKMTLILITIIAITAITFGQNLIETKADQGAVEFQVSNYNCEQCNMSLEEAIGNIVGVEDYQMNSEKNGVVIKYNEAVIKEDWIQKSLEANGYTIKEM